MKLSERQKSHKIQVENQYVGQRAYLICQDFFVFFFFFFFSVLIKFSILTYKAFSVLDFKVDILYRVSVIHLAIKRLVFNQNQHIAAHQCKFTSHIVQSVYNKNKRLSLIFHVALKIVKILLGLTFSEALRPIKVQGDWISFL